MVKPHVIVHESHLFQLDSIVLLHGSLEIISFYISKRFPCIVDHQKFDLILT